MKILKKLIFPFNVLIGAIGLINLGDDIFPAAIRWMNFIKYSIEFFSVLRDILLFPITFPLLEIFEISIPGWLKTYLVLGFLFLNAYNFSHSEICGAPSDSHPLFLIFSSERLKHLKVILFRIFLWPLSVIELFNHYVSGQYKRKHNVYTLWGKYIFWVIIITLLLIFINWVFWQIFDQQIN